MATFVLVHGAWHGGWCWGKVTPLLRSAGNEVYTPTLTGLGERAHLLSPAIDLATHIRDVANVLDYEDLREVVLVGHSYGGVVISGVADQMHERIAHLVYLDALVAENGKSLLDLLTPARRKAFLDRARQTGDGWKIAPDSASDQGVLIPDDAQWLDRRLGPHPLKTFQQPLQLNADTITSLPRTFIYCSDKKGPSAVSAMARAAQVDGKWRYREIHTGHDAMITKPRELATLLLECAS